jgi:recombinational DNA repair protein RecT
MALKTVLKHLLKKYAPKSIESIVMAIESDQVAFTGDIDNAKAVYVDNSKDVQVEDVEVVEVNEETGEVVDTAKAEQF